MIKTKVRKGIKKVAATFLLSLFFFNLFFPFVYVAYADVTVVPVKPAGDGEKVKDVEHKPVKNEANANAGNLQNKDVSPIFAFFQSLGNLTSTETYKGIKLVVNDMYAAKLQTAADIMNSISPDGRLTTSKFAVGRSLYLFTAAIVRDAIGIKVNSDWLDRWDGFDHGLTITSYIKWGELRNLTTNIGSGGAAGGAGGFGGVASKISAIELPTSFIAKGVGIVGAGFSAIEGFSGFAKAFTAKSGEDQGTGFLDGLAGVGNTMMALAPFAAECPPAALILGIGGAVLWGVATLGKLYTNQKKVKIGVRLAAAAVQGIKKAGEWVADKAKSAGRFLRGLFD